MDGEENEMIYEDDVIEVVSLNDEDEQNQLQAGLINMDIGDGDGDIGDIDDSGDGDDGPSFQPLRDDAIACLTEHKGPVFTVCSSNTCSYIASGGQDDRAIVWRSSDYQMLFECTGHHDSVTCLSFSCDDKYLATSDMSGLIQVWSLANGKVIWSFEIGPVEWLLWHHQAHVLLAGDNGGDGWVWLIPSGACKTLPSHGCGNMAASLQPDGKGIYCGYEDGSIKLWDIKSVTVIGSHVPATNQISPVTCLSIHPNGSLVLSGHMDGCARLYNGANLKMVNVFRVKEDGGASDGSCSVECVAFVVSCGVAVVGMVTGTLAIWDLSTQKLRVTCQPQVEGAGLVRMVASNDRPMMYTCHMDGVVRSWDVLTGGSPLAQWHGHSAGIMDLTLTRDESKLISSSDDTTIRVYSLTLTNDDNMK